jgi:hypothetical protein
VDVGDRRHARGGRADRLRAARIGLGATTVRVRDGQTLLTDGPAAELKEQVGGYTLMECADLDEAIKWAASLPAAAAASVEIRPVLVPRDPDPTAPRTPN